MMLETNTNSQITCLGTHANAIYSSQPILSSFCLTHFDALLHAALSAISIAPDCPSLYAINLSPPLPPLPYPSLSHAGEAEQG